MSSKLQVIIIGPQGEPSVREFTHNPKYGDDSVSWRRQTVILDGYRFSPMQCLSYLINKGNNNSTNYYYTGFECLQQSIAYLTSFLRARGISTAYINNYQGQILDLELILKREKPTLAAITTTFTFSAIDLASQVRHIKKISPDTKVVIGGPFVWTLCRGDSSRIQKFMTGIGADYYIQDGQGELALSNLATVNLQSSSANEIPNIWSFDSGSKIWRCKHRQPESNSLNENRIDWSLFSDKELGRSVFIRTARGCAYKCSFCDYPIRQPDYQQVDSRQVLLELETLAKRGVKHIQFVDDTFNIPKERWISMLKHIKESELGLKWMSFFRAAQVQSIEHYELMAESGCRGVLLGIESADNDVLKVMNKGATREKYENGIRMLHETGIRTNALLIIGHPGEDTTKARKTMDFILESGVTYLDAQVYFHNENAPIANRGDEFGIKKGDYGYLSHNGMTLSTANRLVDELFHAALDANINWCMNFDEWDFGYLLSKGMKYNQIHSFSNLLHRIRSLQLKEGKHDKNRSLIDCEITKLKTLISSVELEPARYQLEL